jgi:transcriptional regulator with XRE-family HTH domain
MTAAERICVVCRRTRLSRYNRQQVCASCTRTARETPEPLPVAPQWPTWLWGSAPMREVLARSDLGTAVAMFRVAAQLSQQELAELTGWSQATVSLVETNRRGTLYDIRELLKFADNVCMPREALLPLMLSRPVVLVSVELAADDGQATAENAERCSLTLVRRPPEGAPPATTGGWRRGARHDALSATGHRGDGGAHG